MSEKLSPLPQEKVTEEFVIQGILKEMLRAESILIVDDTKIEFKIVDLMESKIRDSSENKKILIKLLDDTESLPAGLFSVRGGFYRSLVQFESVSVEVVTSHLVWIVIPKTILLTNYRKDDRALVKPSLRRPCPILLVSNGLHCEGTFTIEDTSQEGVGGLLQVPSGYPCGPNTEVRGKLYLDQGEIELNGHLVRASALPEMKHGYDAYQVGIKQLARHQARVEATETRKHERHQIRHEMSLVPLLHPDHQFKLDLVDISISGFSGRVMPGSVIPGLPVGSIFKFQDKSVKAVLVNFDEEVYRFHIISRSESEAIEWLRTMTPVLHEGAQCSIQDARDLYKIFLQAGAISTQYLKRHELYDDALVKQHSNIEDESGYLHRWYIKGADNKVEAHISAIRVSDNCWFIGDLAKVSDSNVDGEALVLSFFSSFAELFCSANTCSTIMVTWLQGHPIWKLWETTLLRNKDKYIVASVAIEYLRSTRESIDNTNGKIGKSYELVFPTINEMLSILNRLENDVAGFLRYGFDLDPNSLCSLSLSKQLSGFKRAYFIIKIEGIELLAIFSKYPSGCSVNRIMDSIYIAKLDSDTKITRNIWDQVLIEARFRAIELGISDPSIRIVKDSKESQFIETSSSMVSYLITPAGLKCFGGFK